MKRLDFELATGDADAGELRLILDQAISEHFDDGFLHHQWDGDVLRLSGPGARGSIVHESGHLRLQAKLRAPASFVHQVIRRRIQAALEDVAARLSARQPAENSTAT